jgi:hypothetical protein
MKSEGRSQKFEVSKSYIKHYRAQTRLTPSKIGSNHKPL